MYSCYALIWLKAHWVWSALCEKSDAAPSSFTLRVKGGVLRLRVEGGVVFKHMNFWWLRFGPMSLHNIDQGLR